MRESACYLLLCLGASALHAQNSSAISQYFEGKQVIVKIDMPGTQQGVDLYPQKDNPFDAKSYSKRIKSFPVALRTGDSVLVTTVKVKDKLIEFQLGGGGFGTIGDDSDTSPIYLSASKSNREKDLEQQLKNTDDPNQRDRIQQELDYLRRQRDRDDQRNRAMAQQAAEVKQGRVDQQRAAGGSRFNIKYDGKVPSGITPEQIVAVLSPYVTFPPVVSGASANEVAGASISGPSSAATSPPFAGLQKGMHEDQVRALLGAPTESSDIDHDGLHVLSEGFAKAGTKVHAEFVNGVLVKYSVEVQ